MRLSFRPDIEGLRGIAILLVVAYHVGVPGFAGGYVGVDVFFVLSGYLITSLLAKELEHTGGIRLAEFYARRARRLLPAVSLVLFVSLLLARQVYAPFEQQGFCGTAVATAAYISNWWFAKESTNYLAAERDDNPYLHTWSLAVEEQFYVVWPVVLLIASKGPESTRRRRLLLTMALLAVLSLAISVWQTRIAAPWAFFGSPARTWEFACGGLGALLQTGTSRARVIGHTLVGWAGMAAVIYAAVAFSQVTAFPGVAAAIPVLGTAAMLVSAASATPSALTSFLTIPPLQWLGRLSYSWYLWHWPSLTIGAALFGESGWWLKLVLAGLALGLAWITFVLVEHPVRSSPSLAARPWGSLGLAVVLTLASLGFAWNARAAAAVAAAQPDQRIFTRAWHEVPKVYARGCHLDYLDLDSPPCNFGEPRAAETLVLFGDSHAAQWFPALERLATDRGSRLISLTKSACPAPSIERFDLELGRSYTECSDWRRATLDRIVAIRPLAVFMSSAHVYVASPRNAGPETVSLEAWRQGTRQTLSILAAAGIRTFVLRDTPRAGFDVPACLARARWNPWLFGHACDFDKARSLDAAAFGAEIDAAQDFKTVEVLDLSDQICTTTTCTPMQDGAVVYRDTNHLTTTFATALAPILAGKLEQRLAESRRARSVGLDE